jgi:hypothetical protein
VHEHSDTLTGHRNVHRPRTLSTTAGALELRIPKVRTSSFFPSLPLVALVEEPLRYYNDHRPHRTLGQAAPLRPLPHRTRTEINNVRQRDRLGGLLYKYQQVT